MKKRIFSVLLVVAMVLQMVTITLAATVNVVITPSASTVQQGDTVTFTVSVSSFSATGMGVQFNYDSTAFEYVSMDWLMTNAHTIGNEPSMNFASIGYENATAFSGNVLKLTLRAKTSAAVNTYTVGATVTIMNGAATISSSVTPAQVTLTSGTGGNPTSKYNGNATVRADKQSANSGDEVKFTVSLSNVTSTDAVSFVLSFDESVFEYVSSKWLIRGFRSGYAPANKLLYIGLDDLTDASGDVAEFTLKVKSGASNGSKTVTVDPIIKHEEDNYTMVTTPATVTIGGTPVSNNAKFTITPSTATVKAGESTTFTVAFSGADGVRSMGLIPTFDESKFTLTDMQILVDTDPLSTYSVNEDNDGALLFQYPAETNMAAQNIMTFTLLAKTGAADGSSSVSLETSVQKDKKVIIPNDVVPATVTIGGKPVTGGIGFKVTPAVNTVGQGESVVVTVSFDGYDKIACMGLVPQYDKSVFTISEQKWIYDTTGTMLCVPDDGMGTASVLYATEKSLPAQQIFSFKLTVNNSAANGTYDVSALAALNNMIDAVDTTVTGAKITVGGTTPSKYSGSATVTADKNTAKAGDEVKFTISLKDVKSTDAISFVLSFDESVFEYISSKWNIKGFRSGYAADSKLLYIGLDDLTNADGDVAEFTLKVKNGAKIGATSVDVSPIIKHEEDNYSMTSTPASVTISQAEPEKAKFVLTPSNATINAGESITFTVVFTGAEGVRSMGLIPTFDESKFTLTDMQILVDTDPLSTYSVNEDNDGALLFQYPAETDMAAQNIMTFTLLAKEDTNGVYEVSLETSVQKNKKVIIPNDVVPAQVEVVGKSNPGKYMISGNVTSYINADDVVTIRLLKGTTEVTKTTTTNGKYSLTGIASGTYTIEVSKYGHTTREYTVNVSGNMTKDLKICPIGDATLDGRVNSTDMSRMYVHVDGTNLLTDEYAFKCANVVVDSVVNARDISRVYVHTDTTNPLWIKK